MATKSITKNVVIRSKPLARNFVRAVENAEGKSSKNVAKKVNSFAMARDARRSMTDNYMISAPLIGQLGKNFANGYDNLIPGDVLLKLATDKVRAIQAVLGGKFVYLECEDKDALLNFYGDNGFVIFGKRDLDRDERDRQSGQYLVQLLKYLGD